MDNRPWPNVATELESKADELERIAKAVRTCSSKTGFGYHRWCRVRVERMHNEFQSTKDISSADAHFVEVFTTLERAKKIQHFESLACDRLLQNEINENFPKYYAIRHQLMFLLMDAFDGATFTDFCFEVFPHVHDDFTPGQGRNDRIKWLLDGLFTFKDLDVLEMEIKRVRPQKYSLYANELDRLRDRPLDGRTEGDAYVEQPDV